MKLRNSLHALVLCILAICQLLGNSEENIEEINPQSITPKIIYRFDINSDGRLDKEERVIAKRFLDQEQADKDLRRLKKKKKAIEQSIEEKSNKEISKIPGIIVSPPSPELNEANWNKEKVRLNDEMEALNRFQSLLQSSDFDSLDQKQIENKIADLKERLIETEIKPSTASKRIIPKNSLREVPRTSDLRKEMDQVRSRLQSENDTAYKSKKFENAAWDLIGKSLDKFKKFDKNGDGKLSQEEKIAFLQDQEDDN